MRTRGIVIVTLAATMLVVLALAGAGWWLVGRNIWGGAVQAQGPSGTGPWYGCGAGNTVRGRGPWGMMGGLGAPAMPGATVGQLLTIQQAKEAAQKYVAGLGYKNLVVSEVMEFTQNYYAIVQESDTGIGAMELLIDKGTGAVWPEYGPNMMWNSKYGMMGNSITSGEMTVTPEEALKAAQRWLDANRPGVVTESEADAFHGYYTIHTLKNGAIEGMLSVNGSTSQVWYHTWHGEFVQMIGGDEK